MIRIRHISELKGHGQKGLKFRVIPPDEMKRIEAQNKPQSVQHLSKEEYTRIMLKAKEGDIAPDEAHRRIVKLGGNIKLRRLPQFPQ
jgi:hypothetical protein